jgi:hypothetical protein
VFIRLVDRHWVRDARLQFCLCALVALFTAGVCAPLARAASVGGGSAFSELTEGGKETSSTATTTSTASTESAASGSGSNTGTVLVLGLGAAVVLIGGIAFLIMRDAHRVAPVPDGQVGGMGRSGRDPAVTMRKRRAKAKAARRQRKRNR